MKDLISTVNQWISEGKRMVLARVIQTWGSSPRPAGSCMIISEKLEMVGSVSGGCVEGAVLKEAKKIFDGEEAKKLSYGVSDEDAWNVGLSCGGKLDVFIQPWFSTSISDKVIQQLSSNTSFSLITKVEGNQNSIVDDHGSLGEKINKNIEARAVEVLKNRIPFQIVKEDHEYLIHSFTRRSRVIIIGAAHITVDLVSLASQFDFETIVIDPRGVFARNTTFAKQPDQLFENYPSEVLGKLALDSHTYAVVLSHDPKIDDDALNVLLRSDVAYIGALGSKKNHEKRTARLIEKGFSTSDISKINAPIGLDIHAVGAKEIALSIMAAIIKRRNENL